MSLKKRATATAVRSVASPTAAEHRNQFAELVSDFCDDDGCSPEIDDETGAPKATTAFLWGALPEEEQPALAVARAGIGKAKMMKKKIGGDGEYVAPSSEVQVYMRWFASLSQEGQQHAAAHFAGMKAAMAEAEHCSAVDMGAIDVLINMCSG